MRNVRKIKEVFFTEFKVHAFGLLMLLALMLVVLWYFDIEKIQVFVAQAGVWGPLVFILAKASTIVVAPISGSAIYPLAGAIFGFWKGFLYIFIGDALGSTIAFYISRIFGKKVTERFLGGGDFKYIGYILEYLNSWRGLIEARIFFAALPEAVAYAAGLSKLPFWKFFVVQTTISIVPIAILVYFGSLLQISNNPIIVGLVLLLGTVVMLIGGSLFGIKVHKKVKHDAENNPYEIK